VARVVRPFAAADVERATSVVVAHYRAVRGLAPRPEFQELLEAARERVERFCERIVARPDRLEQYVAALNRIEPQYVWWWCVAHPELEEQWTN
jgi:DNA invertase Pin-like site-specific DNA recombinase